MLCYVHVGLKIFQNGAAGVGAACAGATINADGTVSIDAGGAGEGMI